MNIEEIEKKIGRPTKYKPEYCQEVIQLGAEGKSKEQIAAKLEVNWGTLDNWAEQHQEFLLALRTAKELELSYWEELGLNHIVESPGSSRLNGGVYNKVMAARFPAKYSERSKVELTGQDGGAVKVDATVSHSLGQEILNELLSSMQTGSESV